MLITISAKCSDRCHVTITDSNGKVTCEHDGYVPNELGLGGGDYIKFTIDNETGRIVGWEPVSKEDIDESLGIYNAED